MDIYESMIKKCSMINFVVDSSGAVVDTNMYTMMLLDTYDITGRDFYSFFDDSGSVTIRSIITSGNHDPVVVNLISANGVSRPVLIVANKVGSYVAVFGILRKANTQHGESRSAVSTAITEKRNISVTAAGRDEDTRMWQLDNIDSLTGLYNRNFFNNIFEGQYLRAVESNWNIGVIVIRIDNLNEIRKNYGIGKRDRLLVGLSQIILGSIRSTDYAVRYEDEDILILLNNPKEKGLAIISERIRASAQDRLGVTISIGCMGSKCMEVNKKDELITGALNALSLSIKQGGNRISIL